MGSTFGTVFRVTTFGESHGGAVGVVVEGCPPRLSLKVEEIQREREDATDFYVFMRTTYLENRQYKVDDGAFEPSDSEDDIYEIGDD